MHFRAFPFDSGTPQSVQVEINDTFIGEIEMMPGWNEYMLDIPDDLIQNTVYRITLTHANATIPPGDSRFLSAAYDWVSIEAR